MSTPSIYTMGQLKAYLASRAAHIESHNGEGMSLHRVTVADARAAAYREVIALIEGIEAHEAATARNVVIATAGQDMEAGTPVTIQGGIATPAYEPGDLVGTTEGDTASMDGVSRVRVAGRDLQDTRTAKVKGRSDDEA